MKLKVGDEVAIMDKDSKGRVRMLAGNGKTCFGHPNLRIFIEEIESPERIRVSESRSGYEYLSYRKLSELGKIV